MSGARHILTLSCVNRPGIVAKVSAALFDGGFNILDAQQFDDTETGNFFMRVEFNAANVGRGRRGRCATRSRRLRRGLAMTWSMRRADERKRVALMVSRFDHCLVDLLYRWRSGEMPMEPVAIIANYPRESYAHIDFDDIPFHHLPITKETKMEQEAQVWETIRTSKADRRRARPLHADSVRRFRRQAAGALHQHPPLVSAGLQGRETLPPGASARRQAHRRDGAFRHFRSRRGSDHRAGRRAHQPPRHAGGARAQGARHRAPGAGARPGESCSRTGCCSTAARRWSSPAKGTARFDGKFITGDDAPAAGPRRALRQDGAISA